MKVRDFFEYLLFTSLNNLSIADNGVDNLTEDNLKRLVAITNSSLVDIYTRIPIKESSVIVEALDWKSSYELHSSYSFYSGNKDIRYIRDSPSYPFTDDIIKIISVTNEVGDILPLNDAEQWASVFTPSYNVIELTHPVDGQAFEITYQASPKRIAYNKTSDFEETKKWLFESEIEIPDTLKELLSIKVASDYFSSMSGQEESSKSQVLQGKYESIIASTLAENRIGTSFTNTNVKLYLKGFP